MAAPVLAPTVDSPAVLLTRAVAPAPAAVVRPLTVVPDPLEPAPLDRGEQFQQAVDRFAGLLFFVVPVVAWWLLRGRMAWSSLVVICVSIGIGSVVALVSVFLAAYFVERRRRERLIAEEASRFYARG